MTKKLKILGPYTPKHPGPFCTRDRIEAGVSFSKRSQDARAALKREGEV